jgi:hypothetical protein
MENSSKLTSNYEFDLKLLPIKPNQLIVFRINSPTVKDFMHSVDQIKYQLKIQNISFPMLFLDTYAFEEPMIIEKKQLIVNKGRKSLPKSLITSIHSVEKQSAQANHKHFCFLHYLIAVHRKKQEWKRKLSGE